MAVTKKAGEEFGLPDSTIILDASKIKPEGSMIGLAVSKAGEVTHTVLSVPPEQKKEPVISIETSNGTGYLWETDTRPSLSSVMKFMQRYVHKQGDMRQPVSEDEQAHNILQAVFDVSATEARIIARELPMSLFKTFKQHPSQKQGYGGRERGKKNDMDS